MNNKAGSVTVLVLLAFSALFLINAGLGIERNYLTKEYNKVLKLIQYERGEFRIGAFRPSSYSGKLQTRLNEGGSETTFKTSPGEGKDGTTLTTAKLGDFIVITVNPGASNEEKISVSAVSTTGSTTATWTIVNRGLSFTSNTSVSGNIKQHAIGEAVIISNDDHYLSQQYVNVDDAQTINGVKTFASTSQPIYDGSPTFTNARSLIDKGYADGLAFQGVATATENTIASSPGAVMLARLADAVGSVASSTSGAPLVLLSRYSTSTYNPASAGNVLVMTGTGGNIDSNFIATSSTFNWSGLHTFSSATTTMNATTSIAASASNRLVLNSLPYTFPATRGASSTVLMENGTGGLRWSNSFSRLLEASTTIGQITSTATTTIYSYLLSGNSLDTGNVVHGVIPISSFSLRNSADQRVEISYGTSSSTSPFSPECNPGVCANGVQGSIEFWLSGAGTTNSQKLSLMFRVGTSTANGITTTFSEDSTVNKKITITAISNGGAGTFNQAILDLLVR